MLTGFFQAAALALETRDRKITGIIAQVLHFPSVCHPKFFPMDKYELGSYRQNHDNPVLNARAYEAFLDAHVPDPRPDFRHSPLLAESHKALPPTCGFLLQFLPSVELTLIQ